MKNYQFKWLLLSIILSLASIATAGAYTYTPTGVGQQAAQTQQTMQSQQPAIQSHQMMHGGSTYQGQVYTPFSGEVPSSQSSPARISGPRRGYNPETGEWTPDAPDMEYAGDTGQSGESPIGEPWVMALFALTFAGVIAIRQYKRKTVKSMNMKNSTSKFIATLALLCTLGVGQIWGWTLNYPFIYFNNSNSDGSQKWDKVMFLWGHDGSSQADNMTQISNTNLWFVKCSVNWGSSLSHLGYGFANTENWGYEASVGFKTRWGYLNSGGNNIAHTGYLYDNTSLDYNTYYFTSSGSDNLSVAKKADSGNWPESTLPVYSAYVKVRKSENGGSSYNSAMTSGTWPGTIHLQGTKIKRNGDKDSGSTPYGKRDDDCAGSNTNSGSQATYDNNIVTGLITMTRVSTDDAAYEFTGWGTGDSPTSTGDTKEYHITGNTTYYAFFKRKQFTVTFEPKGTYGESTVTAAISTTPLTSGSSYNYGSAITFTATPAAGYKLNPSQAWYSDASCETSLGNGTNSTYSVASLTSAESVYVKFVAKQSIITFSQSGEGYASGGQSTTKTATYGSAMPTTISVPTAATGYKFQGYYDAEDGEGTKYYNADGSSARNWDKDTEDGTTLYAYFQKAQISTITFSPGTSAGSTSVTATPTITPTPAGTTYICWGLYKDEDCLHNTDVSFTTSPSSNSNAVTFTTPEASGVYFVKAVLRTGSDCSAADNAADVLQVYKQSYIVASDHTVTIRYQCDGVDIHEPTEVVVPAASTLDDVTALSGDDVFGFAFDHWTMGDGITNETGSNTANPISISATFNGTIIAHYEPKKIIYFKNTLNWPSVYVNLMTQDYWDADSKGSGNHHDYHVQNASMSLVPGTTDIYYYEYTSITKYVSFTSSSQAGSQNFWGNPAVNVVYPTRPNATGSNDDNCGFYAAVPMFVPAAGQTGQDRNEGNSGKAVYYDKGYWCKYDPIQHKTGYKLIVYNKPENSSRRTEYELDMMESATNHGFAEVTIDLEAAKKYGIKIQRADGMVYTYTGSTDMGLYESSSYTTLSKEANSTYQAAPMQSTTAGDYTFMLACDASTGSLKIGVKKPAGTSDYRVVYSDAHHNTARTKRFSRTITKEAGAEDIVSFFIDKGDSPAMTFEYIYSISGGTVTWADGADINLSSYSSVITTSGVYNFYLKQDGSGNISVDKVEPYTGNFYIRTDAVGGTKWADYCNVAHQMTYSDFAAENSGYTHYWMKHIEGSSNTNVKFVVANDYSAWVSDTVIQQTPEVAHIDADGKNTGDVSIRFSYNSKTNVAKRTYLANSTANDFLVLKNDQTASTNKVKVGGVDKSGVDVKFNDNQDYIYDITAQVVPSANIKVKVYAHYNTTDQDLIGVKANGWDGANAQQLLSGTGTGLQTIRILYDFKTNRIVSAWEPVGTITGALSIDADIMIVREHQGSAQNIVLAPDESGVTPVAGKITTAKRIYGVMRFNRWVLNNLSNQNDKDPDHAEESSSDPDYYLNHHTPLSPAQQLPTYQRNLYYISFPFDVNVSDIFGFGKYGTHYAIQRYDGAGRAKSGYWIDSDPNWKWVPPTGKLNAYEGYVLSLSLSNMAADKFDVWANRSCEVELYFPSTSVGATINTEADVIVPALSAETYACTIERDSRNVKDSYWRCIGVPCYANYNNPVYADNGDVITWQTAKENLPFIYDINWQDKSLTAYSGTTFPFKAMHSYLVQYSGAIHWKNVVAEHPAAVIAREQSASSEQTFRLELSQGETFWDQTYVRMTDNEAATTGFDFDQDMWKQAYGTRANIYTMIGDVEVAGNSMPFSNQTTIVPVGVKIATDGDYTFSMPEGTNGTGVYLVDNIAGTRTNLALTDYSVNLTAGTYDGRFSLEISPIAQSPTDNEQTSDDGMNGVRKVMVDGVLYILRDGQVFNARGQRVE